MKPVFEIKPGGAFTLEEAQRVGELLYRITKKKSQRVENLLNQLEIRQSMGEGGFAQLEAQIDQEIREWEGKVERLGGVPRGLWKADLDSGHGYYCWSFPEMSVDHWHGYQDGHSKRICLSGACTQTASVADEDENILLNLQEMK